MPTHALGGWDVNSTREIRNNVFDLCVVDVVICCSTRCVSRHVNGLRFGRRFCNNIYITTHRESKKRFQYLTQAVNAHTQHVSFRFKPFHFVVFCRFAFFVHTSVGDCGGCELYGRTAVCVCDTTWSNTQFEMTDWTNVARGEKSMMCGEEKICYFKCFDARSTVSGNAQRTTFSRQSISFLVKWICSQQANVTHTYTRTLVPKAQAQHITLDGCRSLTNENQNTTYSFYNKIELFCPCYLTLWMHCAALCVRSCSIVGIVGARWILITNTTTTYYDENDEWETNSDETIKWIHINRLLMFIYSANEWWWWHKGSRVPSPSLSLSISKCN